MIDRPAVGSAWKAGRPSRVLVVAAALGAAEAGAPAEGAAAAAADVAAAAALVTPAAPDAAPATAGAPPLVAAEAALDDSWLEQPVAPSATANATDEPNVARTILCPVMVPAFTLAPR
jgi:hypothetical protein